MNDLISKLKLKRLGPARPAGLCMVSLPWPRQAAADFSLDGQPTACLPLGRWPGGDSATGFPRRQLLLADNGDRLAPDTLALTPAITNHRPLPHAGAIVFSKSDDPSFVTERSVLRLSLDGRAIEIAMGLRTRGEIHWWEACRLVEITTLPGCRIVEMGGAIPLIEYGSEVLRSCPGVTCPFIHKHNWVYGKLFIRAHANGVCEVWARHINSRFFDGGADLPDAVPVIGLRTTDAEDTATRGLEGSWDGTRTNFALGSIAFDVAEAARLATPEQPGRMDQQDSFWIWQPYEGMELYSGIASLQLRGDPFLFRSNQHVIPRGMARNVRFSLSLSDASPGIARYQAPAWWYGLCEEFLSEPLLPVQPADNHVHEGAADWLHRAQTHGGFEDGSLARFIDAKPGSSEHPHNEAGWEGDIPYAAFLNAWRSGEAEDHDLALRAAYHFADVAVDHAQNNVRAHGYPPPSISLVMTRVLGILAAYLETGDPWLYETTSTLIDSAHRLHRNAWPRFAMGREACYIRGAVALYRYFADEHDRRVAREGIEALMAVQRPDGAFGDQGGGTGIHQRPGYVVKPWMGTLAMMPLIDYLELFPDEVEVAGCVRRYADWLMANRWDHGDGVRTWSYQHLYADQKRHYNIGHAVWFELPTPDHWHHESVGRVLAYCARRFNEPTYADAWAESSAVSKTNSDHSVSAALQFLPWIHAQLWRARWTDGRLEIDPFHFGDRTPTEAFVETPAGAARVVWRDGPNAVINPPSTTEPVVAANV